MKFLLNNSDLNEALYNVTNLGFVPTMGSLHEGHIYLIKKSLKECNKTIVSIFVNPKQFNNKNDYKKYPRNNKKDISILNKLKVDFLYLPNIKDIYNSRNKSQIKLNKKDKILCAKHRKGHFEGVIDVMDRLTKKIQPKKIFMGEKDFQQLYLVKSYIEKKYISKIISCRTIRDSKKLALSSRNLLLTKKQINLARKISQSMFFLKKELSKSTNLKEVIFIKKKEFADFFKIKIEYLELRNKNNLKITNKIKNSKLFIAYYLNKIRLIDNY